jgi:hypothetical protein
MATKRLASALQKYVSHPIVKEVAHDRRLASPF